TIPRRACARLHRGTGPAPRPGLRPRPRASPRVTRRRPAHGAPPLAGRPPGRWARRLRRGQAGVGTSWDQAQAGRHHSRRPGRSRDLTARTFHVRRPDRRAIPAAKVVHSGHANVTDPAFTLSWSNASTMFHGQVYDLAEIS